MTERESTSPATSPPPLPPDTQVSRYRVVRRIGSGSLLVVYAAAQDEEPRRVALETLPQDLITDAARERFAVAAGVLGTLEHPGIARIHDAGLDTVEGEDGPREIAWLATDYVEGGRPLLEYARDQRLGRRGRLRLFLQACDAVEYAHRRGVLHGHLGPQRLLVDASGRLKITGFGSARLGDPDRLREHLRADPDAAVDTLPYLGPEQLADGEGVDTRADVHALGVVAHELLVGHLPVDLHGQPRRRGGRELETDLEAILQKALAPRPDDRYGSVGALGDDVRRFLDDRPVLAHEPGVLYQLRVFARRRPILAGGGVAILLAVISSAVVSYQHARESEKAERLATDAASQALEQAGRAQIVLQQLLERSTRAATELAPAVQRLDGGTRLATSMMRYTLDDLRLVERLGGNDPRLRVALASAYVDFGTAAGAPDEPSLGDAEGANQSFDHALLLVGPLLAEDPAHTAARWVALRALDGRGNVLLAQGEAEAAIGPFEQALAHAQGLHQARLAELTFEAGLARAHERLAAAHARVGDGAQAAEHLEQSRAGFSRLVMKAPESSLYRHHLALAFQEAGAAAFAQGEFVAARDAFHQAAYLLEPVVERTSRDPRHLDRLAHNVLWAGRTEQELGHLDLAAKRYESALRLYRLLAQAKPGHRETAQTIGQLLFRLGMLEEERGEQAGGEAALVRGHMESALRRFEEAQTHLEALLARFPTPETARLLRDARLRATAVRVWLRD